MSQDTMLYKFPGPYPLQDGNYDYTIVDADVEGAVDAALADGWKMTPVEARLDATPEPAKESGPTRAELESLATELGLKFTKSITDKKLGELIGAALNAKDSIDGVDEEGTNSSGV